MSKTHEPYPAEFRRRVAALARAGRTPQSLAHEFKVSGQSVRNWLKRADLDSGFRHDGLTSEERTELVKLRRENRVLREEREILKKAAAWFARETASVPSKDSSS
jgi:transposase